MSNINNISAVQTTLAERAVPGLQSASSQQQAILSSQQGNRRQPVPARPDQADLSSASLLLSHALSLPDVRVDKVAQIQQALAAGTYRVSSSDLAGKIIDNLQS